MVYNLNLAIKPFILTKEGKKVVEMRLNTLERQQIKIGDVLHFLCSGESIDARVIDIRSFPSFEELYEYYPKEKLGYSTNEECSYHDMEIYYSLSDITSNGVLGFEIELITR